MCARWVSDRRRRRAAVLVAALWLPAAGDAFADEPAGQAVAATRGATVPDTAADRHAPPGEAGVGAAVPTAEGTPAGEEVAVPSAAAAPAETVQRLHAALAESMQRGDALDFAARSRLLEPVIRACFDFPTIARVVLGRRWRALDEAERERFLETFTRLSVATYAARFDAFAGERFRTLDVQTQPGGYRLVRTELVDAGGDAVELAYLVREAGDGWRIVNVIADGVSDLSLKRADYAAVIEADGFEALLAKLDAQIAGYAAEAAGR